VCLNVIISKCSSFCTWVDLCFCGSTY